MNIAKKSSRWKSKLVLNNDSPTRMHSVVYVSSCFLHFIYYFFAYWIPSLTSKCLRMILIARTERETEQTSREKKASAHHWLITMNVTPSMCMTAFFCRAFFQPLFSLSFAVCWVSHECVRAHCTMICVMSWVRAYIDVIMCTLFSVCTCYKSCSRANNMLASSSSCVRCHNPWHRP